MLNKPEGLSSAQAVGRIKKLLGARKAGHAGTLDPFASGVLVCMLNRATRLGRFLLAGRKTYRAVLRLGIETDTQDRTGRITERRALEAGLANRLAEAFRGFEGPIEQQPPAFSALKYKGQPLYKLARQGRPVQKPARRVDISALTIRAVELPEVHFEVTCSAGTYIRALCADIGRTLGCGGHLSALQRTASSGFTLREAIGLDELQQCRRQGAHHVAIVSPAAALRGMATLVADEAAVLKINNGRRLTADDVSAPGGAVGGGAASADPVYVKIIDARQRLCAVVKFKPQTKDYEYCCVFPQDG